MEFRSYAEAERRSLKVGLFGIGLEAYLPMTGEGLLRIGRLLAHPFAQHVHMQVQITGRLRHRNAPFPDQLNSLELELPAELASLHQNSPVPKTP